jgi:hypothetical protein
MRPEFGDKMAVCKLQARGCIQEIILASKFSKNKGSFDAGGSGGRISGFGDADLV